MTSTRLPGKVLKPIAGRPMLSYQVERLKRVVGAPQIVIATTSNAADDDLAAFAEEEGVPVFRGSEHDVLSRYVGAARMADADVVVRVTSDCPMIDVDVIEEAVAAYEAEGAENVFVTNMPGRRLPLGMAVEVVARSALEEINAGQRSLAEREHVMVHFYNAEPRYRCIPVVSGPDLSEHRWTVDTPEDFELVRRIIETVYPAKTDFDRHDVLALLEQHPDWCGLNRHVTQKPATEAALGAKS